MSPSELKKYDGEKTWMLEGIDHEMKEATYFSVDAASHSDLKRMARSPAACLYEKEHPKEPTEAMLRSKALHCLLLEGDVAFAKLYVPKTWDARTKEGKIERDRVEACGVTAIHTDTWQEIIDAARSVNGHAKAQTLLAIARQAKAAENSIFWTEDVPGVKGKVPCKGRVDGMANVGGRTILFDLKWLELAHPSSIDRAIYNQSIHTQLAWYARGLAANGIMVDDCCVIAIEGTAPFETYLYRLDKESLVKGAEHNALRLESWALCKERGTWPAGIEDVIDVGLPKWSDSKEGI